MRCVIIPDDSALPKFVQDCAGKFEYMPDTCWKGAGACTDNIGSDMLVYSAPRTRVQ